MKVHHKVVLQGLDGYIVREESGQILVWKKRNIPSHLWRHHKNKQPFKSNRKY